MEAPQNAPPPPAVLAPSLESELTCSICTSLLYNPLTLLDCLHTFCASCLKSWFHFQRLRAESAPGPPPPPPYNAIFTCPSCRETVRDTRHDARVVSLVDVFVALNPGKGRSAEEKAEMDGVYKKGESVLPRLVKWEGRSEEEVRADEAERRLIEEVQRVSLREATERAVGGHSSSSLGGRGRRSREGSQTRGEGGSGGGGAGGRRHRAVSATLGVGGEADGESTRRQRRSEERQRRAAEAATAGGTEPRQVEHQSSLRNLISTDGMDARDIEKEIEEFAKQIQEEGLLDGLDLDNLDLEHNDELSRRITEAYRRRHRERRRDGGRRSNASAQSYRSDASSTRPRSRTEDVSRPSSRHTARSRAPSASDTEERGRYPPSSSAHLEVQTPSRRRRTSSGGRSATVPVVPTQTDARIGARSQTDLALRAGAARPSMGVDARSSSSPTTVTASGARGDSPATRGLPFSARAAASLSAATAQLEAMSGSSGGNKNRADKPAALDIRPESPTLGSASAPVSPGLSLGTPPLPASPRRAPLPRYKEPLTNCNTCGREHIQYELHFNCAICHGGEWNICLDCWRRRQGCLHWFGFGREAWARWEKRNLALTNGGAPPVPPPHMLTANRYLPPRQIPGGAEGRRVLTTENPLDRLQSGTFCSRCSAWTNDCYWRCDACNDGEWGFCTECVNQGKACTHPLLALAYHPPAPQPSSPPSPTPSSPSHLPTAAATSDDTSLAGAIGNFRPLPYTPPCSACRVPIPQSDAHYHCYACPANPSDDEGVGHDGDAAQSPGEYNLCAACYDGMVSRGVVSVENGPKGWRRCPGRGHRMAVVGFVSASSSASSADREHGDAGGGGRSRSGAGSGDGGVGVRKRKVLRDVVGGRRLRMEEYRQHGQGQGQEGLAQVCSWLGEDGVRVERLMTRDVAASVAALGVQMAEPGRWTETFPPDGGAGPSAVAGWGWVPAAGAEDELLFPRGAEMLEVEDVNGEWFHGFYMGAQGLFPAPYVRTVAR